MFLIKEGKVRVEIDIALEVSNRWPVGHRQWEMSLTTTRYRKKVKTCTVGDMFGAMELIDGVTREKRAEAITDVQLLIINKEPFKEIFNSKDVSKLTEREEKDISPD